MLFAFIVTCIAAELVVRSFHAAEHRRVALLWREPVYWRLWCLWRPDDLLGWEPTPNMVYT